MVTIIEGDSLVNDATGLVVYRFAVAAVVTGKDRRGEEDEETREVRHFSEWEQAEEELEKTLRCIDPTISTLGGEFWGDFLADVGMGNYASA
jgi:hypothetical protein